MDMSTILAAYQSAKVGGEILSALTKLKIDSDTLVKITDVQHRLADAQDGLFAAQSQLIELQSANSVLTQQLANLENWKQTLCQYELVTTPGSAVVYSFKGTPAHYACPNCIGKKDVQILQDRRSISGAFACPGCKTDFLIQPQKSGRELYASFGRTE